MMVMVKVMASKEMIKCSNLKKKKEKNKNGLMAKVYCRSHFLFVLKTP